MKIIHRLFKYLEEKSIPHTRFEKDIGLSNGYLKTQLNRSADIGEGVLLKIIDNSLDLNPLWLLTGEGEMLKNDTFSQKPPPGDPCNLCQEKEKVISSQQSHIDTLKYELHRCHSRLDELEEQARHQPPGQKRKAG